MKVKRLSDGKLVWHCVACNDLHIANQGWSFDGNYENPTFNPSFLVRNGHYATGDSGSCWCTYNASHPERPATFKCSICHTFVHNGQIQYLSDCTHEYAGKTVDMVEV